MWWFARSWMDMIAVFVVLIAVFAVLMKFLTDSRRVSNMEDFDNVVVCDDAFVDGWMKL